MLRKPAVALPDGAVIELDKHAVLRIDGALLKILDPNVYRPIDPSARWHAGFIQEIHVPAIKTGTLRLMESRQCIVLRAAGGHTPKRSK